MESELMALVDQFIEEQYSAAVEATISNSEYKAEIEEMNGHFADCSKSYHDARRSAYLFIFKAQEEFYKKGFFAGVSFAREMKEGATV